MVHPGVGQNLLKNYHSGQLKMSNRIYGIKVSFWGSGTLKIAIPVENYPQKRFFRLDDYHPLWMGGVNERT